MIAAVLRLELRGGLGPGNSRVGNSAPARPAGQRGHCGRRVVMDAYLVLRQLLLVVGHLGCVVVLLLRLWRWHLWQWV